MQIGQSIAQYVAECLFYLFPVAVMHAGILVAGSSSRIPGDDEIPGHTIG